jgi:lysophospholipase L1-like esterase
MVGLLEFAPESRSFNGFHESRMALWASLLECVKMKMRGFCSFLALTWISSPWGSSLQGAEWVRVGPGDARIQYLGRFEVLEKAAKFSWSGSAIRFQLNSRQAQVVLGGASVRYGLRINGVDTAVWAKTKDVGLLPIEVPPEVPLPVKVEIVRINQPLFGESRFEGLDLGADTDLLPPPERPSRWIEFIGDSITAGHGNEAETKEAPLKPETENFLKTYAALTAQSLQAQPVVQAWSGIRLTRGQPGDVTTPDRWGRILADKGDSVWDFSIIPEVVVINLGTNDFGGKAPDEATWTKGYHEFLALVREKYPEARIFCTNGPMLSGNGLSNLKKWTDALVKKLRDAGDARIHTLYFSEQRLEDGIGGQWHPSLRTHAIMAGKLSEAIAQETGWTAEPVEIPPVTQATQ